MISRFFSSSGTAKDAKKIVTLSDIPTPNVIPRDCIDDLFADYEGYTPTFKTDLTEILKKVSDSAHIIIVPNQAIDETRSEILSQQKPFLRSLHASFTSEDVLIPSKKLVHSWTSDEETLSIFNQTINKNDAIDGLLRLEKRNLLSRVKAVPLVFSSAWLLTNGTKTLAMLKIQEDAGISLFCHQDHSFKEKWNEIPPDLKWTKNVADLVHEAKHASKECMELSIEQESALSPLEQTSLSRRKETLCDLASVQAVAQLFGRNNGLIFAKLLTLNRLKSVIGYGHYKHFSSPELSAWTAEQDPSFSWCADSLTKLSSKDIQIGAKECLKGRFEGKEVIIALSPQRAKTNGAKTMLQTHTKLQELLDNNQL